MSDNSDVLVHRVPDWLYKEVATTSRPLIRLTNERGDVQVFGRVDRDLNGELFKTNRHWPQKQWRGLPTS